MVEKWIDHFLLFFSYLFLLLSIFDFPVKRKLSCSIVLSTVSKIKENPPKKNIAKSIN